MTATLTALRNGDLAGARELRLRERLTAFPSEIFALAETLEVLDLSGGALTSLPDDLDRLTKLRVLFCSGNRFERLPPALGDCPALSQVGFRGCGLREIPAESLPPALRWLTLTDNAIETLPAALGERPLLQKLMLSGNRLEALPDSLAGHSRLELLRLAANRFEALPGWLAEAPNLAWLAWAGNPFDHGAPPSGRTVAWSALRPGRPLGEGASGLVQAAEWTDGAQTHPVALKLFKGAMTSDGLPEREMAACLAAGEHPNLTGALGQLVDHPDGAQGLLMALLPPDWRVLAGPPSLESCSRDVYDPALRLDLDVALRIARDVATGAAHLHAKGLSHGDLYAHNILWDGAIGQAVLSDLGGASFLPNGPGDRLDRLDVLAFGRLLAELLARVDGAPPAAVQGLLADCLGADAPSRPSLAHAANVLG
ncbi:leucine-rich repeat-containing protein kinase family protein [Caulobacter sp. Root1472]|uniref:leucine-rich repeat-containing protein kinase family protein n=1 Tax=Caulobacter sp. Root1472 TaxID=1736470 RepID=UPI0006F4EE29|nr:leucine-rich repeat-containing protein kinase family protein [Caulobacter sp. Root1472]KQZ30709.1 protein kinase [Caulobacter sp. Root1472]